MLLLWGDNGIGAYKNRDSSSAALCLTYISLNSGADALPDPQQDSQGPDTITAKDPAWEDSSHSENPSPRRRQVCPQVLWDLPP